MGLVKNLFATNCIHKLLNFTYDFLEIRNFESGAMSFILISSILQKNLPALFLPELDCYGRDRGEMFHVAFQMYSCTQHIRNSGTRKASSKVFQPAFLCTAPSAHSWCWNTSVLAPKTGLLCPQPSALSVSDASIFSYLTALEKIKPIQRRCKQSF